MAPNFPELLNCFLNPIINVLSEDLWDYFFEELNKSGLVVLYNAHEMQMRSFKYSSGLWKGLRWNHFAEFYGDGDDNDYGDDDYDYEGDDNDDDDDGYIRGDDDDEDDGYRQTWLALPRLTLPPTEHLARLPEIWQGLIFCWF